MLSRFSRKMAPPRFGLIAALLLICVPALSADQWQTLSQYQQKIVTLPTEYGDKTLYAKSYALVISASAYEHGDAWDSLDDSKLADNVAAALGKQGFAVLRFEHAKASNLLPTIKKFLADYGTSDARLLVYFAGHGHSDTKKLVGYIVPEDAVNPDTQPEKFAKQAVSTLDILSATRASKAQHILFVFNSCFSAMVFTTQGHLPALRHPSSTEIDSLIKPARQFLTATAEDEPVSVLGPFTSAFIEGIQGGADNDHDGMVTGLELAAWIRTVVSSDEHFPTVPQYGDVQSHGGDFTFVPPASVRPADGAPHKFRVTPAMIARTSGDMRYSKYHVYYFRKPVDSIEIFHSVEQSGIPYSITRNSKPQIAANNTIACSGLMPAGGVGAVKALALKLIDLHVPLLEIQRFHLKPDTDPYRIELLTSGGLARNHAKPLSRSQVEALTKCPKTDLHN
jgi:hypothetical protein